MIDEVTDGYARRKKMIRGRILKAAITLIRETGGTDFSVRQLAAKADVSPATPFNHLGSKIGIFTALIIETLNKPAQDSIADDLDPDKHWLSKAIDAMLSSSALYASDPELYRPLFKAILGSIDQGHPTVLFAVDRLSEILIKAAATGQLQSSAEPRFIAQQMERYWIGSLMFWVSGSMTGEAWQRSIDHGLSMLLASIATDTGRPALLMRMEEAAKHLELDGNP